MSEIVKDRIVVLRTYPYGESSAVVFGLARRNGKVRLLAKGCKRPGSPLRSALRAGSICEGVFYARPARNLQLLKECEEISSYPSECDFERMCLFQAGLELIDRVIREGEGDERLFDILERYLSRVRFAADPWALFLAFEISVLEAAGLFPSLDSCAICGRKISEEGFAVDTSRGTVSCKNCQPRGSDILSPGASREFLRLVREGISGADTILNLRVRKEIGNLVHRIMCSHLEGYRMLNALKLCRWEKAR